MKKIICTAVSAMALAAFAEGVNSTEFGVLQVPSTAKQTIVSVPWLESGTTDTSITVSNLVLTAGLSNGDRLRLYSNGSYTQNWRLNNGKWEPVTIATAQGVIESGDDQTTIDRGMAIMLVRDNPGANGFYLMGKPATAGETTTLGTGYSLVAPPAVTETDLNNTSVITWANLADDDKILIASTNGLTISTYAWVEPTDGDTTKWCKWDKSTHKWVADGVTIPAGMGAWFVNGGKGSGTKSFTYGTKK